MCSGIRRCTNPKRCSSKQDTYAFPNQGGYQLTAGFLIPRPRHVPEPKPHNGVLPDRTWAGSKLTSGFLRTRHRLLGSQGCMKVLCRTWVSRTTQSLYMLRQSNRMGEGTPSRSTLSILFACTRVDTCLPGDCMHSTSMNHLSLVRNLG